MTERIQRDKQAVLVIPRKPNRALHDGGGVMGGGGGRGEESSTAKGPQHTEKPTRQGCCFALMFSVATQSTRNNQSSDLHACVNKELFTQAQFSGPLSCPWATHNTNTQVALQLSVKNG